LSLKRCIFAKLLDLFRLGFQFFKTFWTRVGLGLSFKNSGMDLDRKLWKSAHLSKGSGLDRAGSGL